MASILRAMYSEHNLPGQWALTPNVENMHSSGKQSGRTVQEDSGSQKEEFSCRVLAKLE